MMKIFTILIMFAVNGVVSATDLQLQKQLTKEARAEVKKLGGGLKNVLQTQMKTKGPVAAVEACKIEAPQIAEKINSKSEWQVGRTSLKIRNLENIADEWEEKVLEYFQYQLSAGVNPASLEFSEIVDTENGQDFRYMKAITTKKVCLACHGTDIASSVIDRVNALYPQDKATGYVKGEVRGAFTLTKTIP